MQVAGITTIVGSWVRIAGWEGSQLGILPLMIGSMIASIGQPFYLNSPSALASQWFGANEQAMATSIATLAFPFGALLGFILPDYFFPKPAQLTDIPTLFHQNQQYLFIANVMITLMAVGSIFLIKKKPLSPPSADVGDGQVYPMKKGFMELMKNKNYVFLFMTFNFVYGVYSALPSMLTQLTKPFGTHGGHSLGSNFAVTFLVSGIVASFLIGFVLDKFQNYKAMTIMLSCFTCLFSLLQFYTIRQTDNPLIMTIGLGCFGAAIIPMLTVAFPFAVELTRPVPEGFSNGMLITLGLLWGSILAILATSVPNDYAFGIFALCSGFAIVFSSLIKEDLRRLQNEEVMASAYVDEEKVKQMSVMQRASILDRSKVIENPEVRFKFSVSDNKALEFSRMSAIRRSQLNSNAASKISRRSRKTSNNQGSDDPN
jgi:MFS family permease